MIVTARFVFLHLHKSGGSFVNEFLLRHLSDARPIGYHLPRRMIPPIYDELPALGLVRNPWSYYVSWFTFQSNRPTPNVLFKVLSENGRLDFKSTVRNMLELGSGGSLLQPLIEGLPTVYTNRGLNLPGFALEPLRDSGIGFYSFLYRHIYAGGRGLLRVGRMEFLRSDLLALLTAVGQPLGAAAQHFLLTAGPRNASDHTGYTHYYDDSLRDLVADRDAELIEQHGYRFGEAALPSDF
jgi:hypothetical protein